VHFTSAEGITGMARILGSSEALAFKRQK